MLAILDLFILAGGVGLVAATSFAPFRVPSLEVIGGLLLVMGLVGLGTLVAQAGG